LNTRKVAVAAAAGLTVAALSYQFWPPHSDQTPNPQTTEAQPATGDYDAQLSLPYLAADSSLEDAAAPLLGAASRLTLAVGDGQTLAGVLADGDVPAGEAQAAIEAVRSVYDPRRLRAGQFVTIDFKPGSVGDTTSLFDGFELQADAEHLVTVVRNQNGYTAEQTVLPVKTETRAAHGVIRNSVVESIAAAGVPNTVTAALIRAFSYDVDFERDIQPGDRFKVMYDALISQGGVRSGDVQYAELILSGKVHAIYGVRSEDGTIEFYTRDGKSIKRSLLRTPVDGARLTSGFGMRMHPILGYTRMHKGVDFGVPTGTPIFAAGDGVVEQAGWAGGYGRFVLIRHNSRMETAYGHMSRLASVAGQHVRQGQVIGYVGMTGSATGPHLHYEVRRDGAQVNPISVTLPINTGLEGNALVAFLKTVDERETRFAALANGTQFAAAPPH
jgi:murein DD-endopeptidase MepM/ murein hydrolase activator NlpD